MELRKRPFKLSRSIERVDVDIYEIIVVIIIYIYKNKLL